MKKFTPLLLACALSLWAADFWATKPYTDWNAKELQKIVNDSPWAHRVDVELKVTMPTLKSQSEGGGRSRGGGGGGGGIATADGSTSVSSSGEGRGGAGAPSSASDSPVTQTLPVMLVWQTALPVKQALAKSKYGAELATSAEAKAYLEREEIYYVIEVSGLPAGAAELTEGDKKTELLQATAMTVKGKEAVHAVEVQMSPRGRTVDALFAFPRTTPVGADDKEVEFSTRIEKLVVRGRFKPKDMTYHGKFEM